MVNLLTSNSYSYEIIDCSKYKKLSNEYLVCKANNIKTKTLSTGENIIKQTKGYQKKEWSEEIKKLENVINY